MAMIIIPEEAEYILSVLNAKSPVHLLTYTAPVTRKMLHFNDLKYYSVPPLPADWQAPTWLKIELGIFAGRLYFEYDEYPALYSFLGIVDRQPAAPLSDYLDVETQSGMSLNEKEVASDDLRNTAKPAAPDEKQVAVEDNSKTVGALASDEKEKKTVAEIIDNTVKAPTLDEKEKQVAIENVWAIKAKSMEVKKPKTFTAKLLTFMQEWLSLRRKGQDFAQTPMGYVCQGKVLKADHPFFAKVDGAVHIPIEAEFLGEGVDGEEGDDDEDLSDYDDEHDDDGSMDVNLDGEVVGNERKLGHEG
jgi:hypothetical protein